MLKIRRSRDSLIFNMGIPILVRQHLHIETAPGSSSELSALWIGFIKVFRAGMTCIHIQYGEIINVFFSATLLTSYLYAQ